MISEAFTIDAVTPTKIVSSVNFEQFVYIHNEVGGAVYLGGSDVATTTGYHLANHENVSMRIPQDNELYAICASGTGDIHLVRPD